MTTQFQESANFIERRAAGDIRPPDNEWHLDKKVPLSLIFAMLVQAGMVIWAVADIKKDVELLKASIVTLYNADKMQQDDLKEAIKVLQAHYTRMDSKLDRLIERGQK